MGRFDDRATQPARGPKDLLRWRVWDTLAEPPRRIRQIFSERELDPSGLWLFDIGETRALART